MPEDSLLSRTSLVADSPLLLLISLHAPVGHSTASLHTLFIGDSHVVFNDLALNRLCAEHLQKSLAANVKSQGIVGLASHVELEGLLFSDVDYLLNDLLNDVEGDHLFLELEVFQRHLLCH